jgi:hypothetical protein
MGIASVIYSEFFPSPNNPLCNNENLDTVGAGYLLQTTIRCFRMTYLNCNHSMNARLLNEAARFKIELPPRT